MTTDSITLEFMKQLGEVTSGHRTLKSKMDTELKSLRAKNASLVTKLNDATKKLTELSNGANQVRALLSDTRLAEVKEDTTTIHALYKINYLKTTVSTEIAMLTKDPKILHAMIRAFDMSDDWWNQRRSIPLKQWKDELGKLAIHLAKHKDDITSFEPIRPDIKPKTVMNYVDEITEDKDDV